MTTTDLVALFRRSWWILVICIAAGGAAGYGLTTLQTPIYRASATILVVQTQGNGSLTLQDIQASQSLTATYANLVTSPENLSRAADPAAGLNLAVPQLESKVSASAIRDTQLVEISAEDSNAQRASLIANSVANAFPDYIEAVRVGGTRSDVTLNPVLVARKAAVPDSPVRPSKALNTALGILGGLVLGIAAAFVRGRMDDRVRSRSDVLALEVPALGAIPQVHRRRRSRNASSPMLLDDPRSQFAESWRQVQANLAFTMTAAGTSVVLVTSPSQSEGKTVAASNLAIVLAETGKRVLVIDGDLRRPMLHRRFRLPNAAGLTGAFLSGAEDIMSFTSQINENLSVLVAGAEPPNPAQVIASPRFRKMLQVARESFDIIVIDTPPVLGVADTALWLSYAQGAVLVARAGRTRISDLEDAIAVITASPAALLGAVLNETSGRVSASARYYAHPAPRGGHRLLGDLDRDGDRRAGDESAGAAGRLRPNR